jgi:hypothetical protein
MSSRWFGYRAIYLKNTRSRDRPPSLAPALECGMLLRQGAAFWCFVSHLVSLHVHYAWRGNKAIARSVIAFLRLSL